MSENSKTINDKKKELEAQGYEFSYDYNSHYWHGVETSEGWYYEGSTSDDTINEAYSHLLDRKKIVALEQLVYEIATNKAYSDTFLSIFASELCDTYDIKP